MSYCKWAGALVWVGGYYAYAVDGCESSAVVVRNTGNVYTVSAAVCSTVESSCDVECIAECAMDWVVKWCVGSRTGRNRYGWTVY